MSGRRRQVAGEFQLSGVGIPYEARGLQVAANSRSFASLRMTIHYVEGLYHSPAFTSFFILRLIRSRFNALMCEM